MDSHAGKHLGRMGAVCALLALFTAGPAAATQPALLRTTLLVADVDRTAAFYRLLGFTPERDLGGPRSPDSPFPLASRSTRFRLLILASGHPASGRIGLLQFDESAPPVVVPAHPRLGIGDMVFVIEVDDADAAHTALKAAGAGLVEEPFAYEMQRADGTVGRGRLFHVFDPDGRLIEVMAPAGRAP
jgi:catechol 2,3-dioxygenase-like lactoylglutathione lyase family enzyme